MAEVEDVNFPTGKQQRSVGEEVDAVEADSESTSGCGVEALVTAGDIADRLEVILISFPNLPAEAERRVIADQKCRRQQRFVLGTLWRNSLSIPLVEGYNQLLSPGVVGVLDEFLDNTASKRESASAGHLLQKRTNGTGYVVSLSPHGLQFWQVRTVEADGEAGFVSFLRAIIYSLSVTP
jgi:hypothetical protein